MTTTRSNDHTSAPRLASFPSFFRLPQEIRDHIYRLLYVSQDRLWLGQLNIPDEPIDISYAGLNSDMKALHPDTGAFPPLYIEEALNVFSKENTFLVEIEDLPTFTGTSSLGLTLCPLEDILGAVFVSIKSIRHLAVFSYDKNHYGPPPSKELSLLLDQPQLVSLQFFISPVWILDRDARDFVRIAKNVFAENLKLLRGDGYECLTKPVKRYRDVSWIFQVSIEDLHPLKQQPPITGIDETGWYCTDVSEDDPCITKPYGFYYALDFIEDWPSSKYDGIW